MRISIFPGDVIIERRADEWVVASRRPWRADELHDHHITVARGENPRDLAIAAINAVLVASTSRWDDDDFGYRPLGRARDDVWSAIHNYEKQNAS